MDEPSGELEREADALLARYGIDRAKRVQTADRAEADALLARYGIDRANKVRAADNAEADALLARYGIDRAKQVPTADRAQADALLARYGIEQTTKVPVKRQHGEDLVSNSSGPSRRTWHQNPLNWVLIVMGVVAVTFFWWASGWAGIPQSDGVYTCEHEYAGQGLGNIVGLNPAVQVSGGEVVSVTVWDPATDVDVDVPASDYEKIDPTHLAITVDGTEYECTKVSD